MAGTTPLQQIALAGLVIVCALVLLLSMKSMRRKLHMRRGARRAIWSAVAVLIVLFIAAYGLVPDGSFETSGGVSRSAHR
jgi:Na+/H+ antiporter NhaD/arsenite permease-like protein